MSSGGASNEGRRGPISGFVGGIPIVNTSYSGRLTGMSKQALLARLSELLAADPDDEDCDEAFGNRMDEISAVQRELQRRQGQ